MFILEKLKIIEESMDMANCKYGSKDSLCIYCGSKEYNGRVGIVHYRHCPIKILRELINSYEKS